MCNSVDAWLGNATALPPSRDALSRANNFAGRGWIENSPLLSSAANKSCHRRSIVGIAPAADGFAVFDTNVSPSQLFTALRCVHQQVHRPAILGHDDVGKAVLFKSPTASRVLSSVQ